MRRYLLNSYSQAGLPPAAKTVLSGSTDLDEVKPKPTPPAQPSPAPAPETKPPAMVKDEKWLETEIAHTEDKLRTLREQKSAATPKSEPKRKVRTISTLPIFGGNESED